MSWATVYRYRENPVTVVTLDCGHYRVIDGAHYDLPGTDDVKATCHHAGCHEGQPGMRYVVASGVIR